MGNLITRNFYFWDRKNLYLFFVLIISGFASEFSRGYNGMIFLLSLSVIYNTIYKIY